MIAYQRRLSILFLLAGLLIAAHSLLAQADVSSATLKGTVSDPAGRPIAGAIVTVSNSAKGTKAISTTGGDGVYYLPQLAPGSYDLTVEEQGFSTAIVHGIELSVGQSLSYPVSLSVGTVRNVTEVTAREPLIQVEQPQQANTVGSVQIQDLPNTARDFTSAIYTLPGVASSNAPRSQNAAAFTGFFSSGFSLGGSNGRNNLFSIDGGEDEYGDGDVRMPNLSQEAIEEFQVNRNAFAAEFGFTSGTSINAITRSGSNTFHGSDYVYFLDEATEARNFFDITAGKPFEQHLFTGATLGGPVAKNKIFFFSSYEYRRLNTPEFRNYTTPAAGMTTAQQSYLQGLLTSGNPHLAGLAQGLGASLVPLAKPGVAALFASNSGVFGDVLGSHDALIRLDDQLTSKDVLNLRFSLERYHYTNIGGSPLFAPSDAANTVRNDNTILLNWNHVLSPALVNTFRAQVVPGNSTSQTALSPASSELSISGIGTFGQSYQDPFYLRQRRLQFDDTITWQHGSHNVKAGVSDRPVHYDFTNKLFFAGQFTFYDGAVPLISLVPAALQPLVAQFNLSHGLAATGDPATNLSALQSFALGIPVAYRQGFGNPVWNGSANHLGLFAQDSWKALPTLTIDYGVRLDYDAEPSPLPHNNYVSPRLGIAWDPFGDRKTVVRAGGGIFVAPVNFQISYLVNLLSDSGQYINQFAATLSPTNQTVVALWALGTQEGKLPSGQLNAMDLAMRGITPQQGAPGRVIGSLGANYQNEYAIQSSASVARQLANSLSLELGYLFYRGVHIPLDQDTNYRETGAIDPIYGPQYTPVNPTVVQQDSYTSGGNSIYHGMTASLTRRFGAGLQFQANYTWSKSIDDATDFNSSFASFWPTRQYLERGISAFNVKDNFVANAVYKTPFKPGRENGWTRAFADITVAPMVYARSGIPFSITVPGATNGTQGDSLYARPWYIARNTGIGPPFYSADLRVSKSFFLRRDMGLRLDLSADGTNLLNHTNFSAVNNVFAVGDPFLTKGPFNVTGSENIPASQPLGFTAANNPRQVQFGLKLAF